MAHRRKERVSKKELERKLREERKLSNKIRRVYKDRPKTTVGSVIMIALLVLVVYQATTNVPPFDYEQCFSTGTVVQHKHFRLLIQIGERFGGGFNLLFVRIPENMGLASSCRWPVHTHGDVGDERDLYYTKIHVEASYNYAYTLSSVFETWGEWLSYPRGLYFGPDGVSYYRSSNVEVWLRYGPTIDPANANYTRSVLSNIYYVPQDGDVIELLVHEPYTTLACPYYPYSDPSGPGCGQG